MRTKAIIRRFGSLFFLGIFLWFYSVKDIHDVVHGDDFHCHVKNAKHIHQAEHHCPICDVTLPHYNKPDAFELPEEPYIINVVYLNIQQEIAIDLISSSLSRGPPQLI